MRKYIDAEGVMRACYDSFLKTGNKAYREIFALVEAAPVADVVEVVRCKDCKHYQFADNRAFGMPVKMCEWFGFEDVDDDDFCSRAERKEE